MLARINYIWRLLGTGLSFVLFGVGSLIMGYLLFPLVALLSKDEHATKLRCRKVVRGSFKMFIWFMESMGILTWTIEGEENLPESGCLVLANHPTLIDIVFLISMIPNSTCIVKLGLFKNPITYGPVKWSGFVANNTAERLIHDAGNELQEGACFIIFPEGTRSVRGNLNKFKRGGAYIYMHSRCNLVLIKIDCSPLMLSKYQRWFDIPQTKPHYVFCVDKVTEQIPLSYCESKRSLDVRKLTNHWQSHFTQEAMT